MARLPTTNPSPWHRGRSRGSGALLFALFAALALGVSARAGSAGEREPQLTFVRSEQPGLFAVGPDGGPETRLIGGPAAIGPSAWSPGGSRIAFVSDSLYVADAAGTGARRVARRVNGTWSAPAWAPGGRRIAFERGDRIVLVDVETRKTRVLGVVSRRDLHPAWSPDGREIAHTTTPRGRDPLGPESRVAVTNVRTGRTRVLGSGALPAWSPDGKTLAFRGAGLYVVPRSGGPPTRVSSASVGYGISWSPDGRRILFAASAYGVSYSIRTVAADGSDERVLSESSRSQGRPAWSPGGARVAFLSTRDFPAETGASVYVMNADGSCQVRLTFGGRTGPPAWRPVGSVPPLRCD